MGLFDALKRKKEESPDKAVSKSAVEIAKLVDSGQIEQAIFLLNRGMMVYDNFAQIVAQQMNVPVERANQLAFELMDRLTNKYMARTKAQQVQLQQQQQLYTNMDQKREQTLQEVQSIMTQQSGGIRR